MGHKKKAQITFLSLLGGWEKNVKHKNHVRCQTQQCSYCPQKIQQDSFAAVFRYYHHPFWLPKQLFGMSSKPDQLYAEHQPWQQQ
jgi:hypothetical protein